MQEGIALKRKRRELVEILIWRVDYTNFYYTDLADLPAVRQVTRMELRCLVSGPTAFKHDFFARMCERNAANSLLPPGRRVGDEGKKSRSSHRSF
jgi:hypothetical protein